MMFAVGLSSLTWPRQQLHHGSGNSFASALPTWPKIPDTLNITAQIRIFEEMPPLLEQRLKCPIVSICLSELQFEVIRRENVQCPREHSHLKQLRYHFRMCTGAGQMAKGIRAPCREPEFNSQYPCGWLQPFTSPVWGHPIPSSDLFWHQAQSTHGTHPYMRPKHWLIKNINLTKRFFLND